MTEYAKLVISVDSRDLLKTKRHLESLPKETRRVESDMRRMGAAAAKVGGVLAAAFSVREIAQAAEQYTNITNRLRLVTSGAEELARAQQDLFRIAQNSRQPLNETAELYQRIATNQDALGLSGAGVARITETISKSLAVSGTSAASAAGALTQLGQAFASGQLRGEELNSVLENAPALASALADGMGVTVGQLRALGAEGKITAQTVVDALLKQTDAMDEAFSTMAPTVSGAVTTVGNSFTQLIGRMDETGGASESAADQIMHLATILSDPATVQAAQAMAGGVATALGAIATAATNTVGMVQWAAEEMAAMMNGIAADDVVRLQQELERLQKMKQGGVMDRTVVFGRDGIVQYYDDQELDSEMAKIEAALTEALNRPLINLPVTAALPEAQQYRSGSPATARAPVGMIEKEESNAKELAAELAVKRELTEQEQIRIDILRESGQLRAANDAQFQLEFAEKIAEYERQGNEEAVRRLETLRQIREIQMNAAQAPGLADGVSQAPAVTGLDGAVGGASSEITRLNEEAEALAEWRATELEKQREFLEARAISAEQFAEREHSINEKAREGLAKIETAKNQAIVNSSADFFGNMAVLSQSGNKELGAIGKAAAIAQATMQGFVAVGNALAVPPYPVGLALAASAAVVTAANVAQIAGVGFSAGGYTGDGGKFEPMGVVHGGEYVLRKEIVSQPGMLSYLDSLNSGKGYASGGFVGTAPLTTPTKGEGQSSGVTSVQIINNGEPMSARTEIDGATMKVILDRVQTDFVGSLQGDGKYSQAISQTYGLQRSGR
ncbi:tape measure protein [Stutzerimonas kunmingensis]|uniref:Tape measure protein n=1 Tax=Stutzerimonas kunmingensis TaxID=1211807 RepID=A0A9X1N8D6_9GAMM|nr:tape measure protein [Stutzerimonas kunmingensis]MCD1609841.1 tape measure protein [Stutzerimonas kunmingensis]PNF99466.1 hypothetical protein CXK98_18315 [Stutzerimonas kunmingensis]